MKIVQRELISSFVELGASIPHFDRSRTFSDASDFVVYDTHDRCARLLAEAATEEDQDSELDHT